MCKFFKCNFEQRSSMLTINWCLKYVTWRRLLILELFVLSRKYFVPEHARSTKIMLPRVILVGGVKSKVTFVSFPLSSNYQMELTHPELENDWQTNNVVPAPLSCNVTLRIIEWFFKFLSVIQYICSYVIQMLFSVFLLLIEMIFTRMLYY